MDHPSISTPAESRDQTAYLTLLGLYALPGLGLALFNLKRYSPEVGWGLFTSGLFLTIAGTLAFITFLKSQSAPQFDSLPYPQKPPLPTPSEEDRIELQRQIHQLTESLRDKEHQEQLLRKEATFGQEKIQEMMTELTRIKEEGQQELQHKETLLSEYLNTISEQRALLEKKQLYILKLENKVHDLSYEIKTLLHLETLERKDQEDPKQEKPLDHPVMELFSSADKEESLGKAALGSSDPKVQTPHDASLQLQKCVETAESLTGNSHLTSTGQNLLTPSVESHTIDLRRLGDRFRDETHCLIALFSPQEERFFFVNQVIKSMMGWSPEKFNKNFFQLIQEGHLDWKHALKQLNTQEEARTRLILATKSGENLLVHCHLAKIQKGVFQNQVIAVMYAD